MGSNIVAGDKIYVVTREDLSHGQQAVQSIHALRQFVHEHPEVDSEWFERSNYLALLSVQSHAELVSFYDEAKSKGLKCSAFYEPDLDNAMTALAIEPGKPAALLCRRLPLAMKACEPLRS